jgi:subtilisin-like proprotein convertase family protein
MVVLAGVFVSAAVLATPRAASAIPFSFNGPGALNVDTNPATAVNLLVGAGGTILDLNVFVEIAGGHMEDFEISLTSPSATTVKFRANFNGDDFPFTHIDSPLFATFDDEAILPHTAQTVSASGTFQPFLPLSAFDGESLVGVWTLSILDDFVPGEGDILVTWRIFGEQVDPIPEPATLMLVGAGLVGAAARLRRRAG